MCVLKTFRLLSSLPAPLSLCPVFVRLRKKHAFKQFRKNLRLRLPAKVYFSICSKPQAVMARFARPQSRVAKGHRFWSDKCFEDVSVGLTRCHEVCKTAFTQGRSGPARAGLRRLKVCGGEFSTDQKNPPPPRWAPALGCVRGCGRSGHESRVGVTHRSPQNASGASAGPGGPGLGDGHSPLPCATGACRRAPALPSF